MPKVILTDARVKVLRPRRTAYDIRDGKLRGFGVRVLPSGRKRFFVHCQHRGERVWKIVGDATAMGVGEARSCAVRTLAAIRRGEDPPRDPAETLFEAVAETVFERYRRLWKPGTLNVNRCYLKNQILPRFQGRQVADIDRRDVRDWFASLRATPVAADRSMPVLSVIMREAEAMGLRPRGQQPLPGHPALSPQGARALPVRRRDAPAVGEAVGTCGHLASAGRRHPAPLADRMPQERDPDAPLVLTTARGISSSETPRRGPAPSGCRGRPGTFSTGWTGPDSGCSRRRAAKGRGTRAGSKGSGTRFVPKPGCAAFACTTSATRMPASPCGKVKPFSPSPGCSVTGTRKPRSSTRTSPTKR